jgi:hypothetical protein
MRRLLLGLFIALAVSAGTAAWANVPPESELLEPFETGDPNWKYPTYFIAAADADVLVLKQYLRDVCAEHKLDTDVWFCGAEQGFFYSGIDAWGNRSKASYACERQIGLPGMRYFSDARFLGCFFLWWDEREGSYEIKAPSDHND